VLPYPENESNPAVLGTFKKKSVLMEAKRSILNYKKDQTKILTLPICTYVFT